MGDEPAFRRASEAMLQLPMVEAPLTLPLYQTAIDLSRRGRTMGLTIRSSVDCLIAACALRNDFDVLYRDRDFAALARICPLRQRQI